MHLKPNPPNHEHELLYDQFLAFIKRGQNRTLQPSIEMNYKKLHSDLQKELLQNRRKVLAAKDRGQKIKSACLKFHKIEGKRQLTELKRTMIQEESPFPVTQEGQSFWKNAPNESGIEDEILMEQFESQQLRKEIDNYNKSIGELRKTISGTKQQIKAIDIKQNKFREVHHLANNISQFTEQMTLSNLKEYNQLISNQESTLKSLKKIKNRVKNELFDSEGQYHLQRKQNEAKFSRIMRKSHQEEQEKQNMLKVLRKNMKPPKQFKKFLQSVEKVLDLLASKESNYELIKQQQCTKLGTKSINTDLVPAYKQWARVVQEFQKNFQLRVESCDKIIVKLFKQIRQQNDEIEKKILEKKYILEQSTEEYQSLLKKAQSIQVLQGTQEEEMNEVRANRLIKQKMEVVRSNSLLFVQTLELVNTVLMRFRYIFKVFIMMNIDKKKLNSQLLKLDDVLDSKGSYSTTCKISDQILSSSSEFKSLEDTNASEIQAEAQRLFPNLEPDKVSDLVRLLFNDIRAALICRKNLILEELTQCKGKDSWEEFTKCIQIIRQECEYNYIQKVKICFQTLLECLKSVSKGSCFGSKQGEICLPATMFPKANYHTGDYSEDQIEDPPPLESKWVLQFIINQQQKNKPEQWGEQQKRNPSEIVRKLQSIRNNSCKKFKLLDQDFNPRKYLNPAFQDYRSPSEKQIQNRKPQRNTFQSRKNSSKSKTKLNNFVH